MNTVSIKTMEDRKQELYSYDEIGPAEWQDKSFISGRLLLVFVVSGTASYRLNGFREELTQQDYLILHPHVEINQIHASEDFKANVIGFYMALQENVTAQMRPSFFSTILRKPKWTMDEEDYKAAMAFCTLFDYNCNHSKSMYGSSVASSLLTVFLQTFYQRIENLLPEDGIESSVLTRSLMWRFMTQVSKHYHEEHQVSFYAEQLCVSAKYLTQVVKKSSGHTPKELIDKRISVEAIYMLGKSSFTIQEISNQLGFPDQSYFGRFFKRMFGISPLSYRMHPDLSLISRLNDDANSTENFRKLMKQAGAKGL